MVRRSIIAISILSLILPKLVVAHGILVFATPAPNSILDDPPAQVALTFSESLATAGNILRVRGTDGTPVDLGDVRVDPQNPNRLTVSLVELGEGVYIVEYRVLSTVDGHFTLGSFVFGLGAAEVIRPLLENRLAPSQDLLSVVAEAGVRWPGLLAQAILLGGFAFGYFLWRSAYQSHLVDSEVHQKFLTGLRRMLFIAWALLLFSHLGSYGYRAWQQVSTGSSMREGLAGIFVPLLTNYGHIWLLNLGLILFLGLILRSIFPRAVATPQATFGARPNVAANPPSANWRAMRDALLFAMLLVLASTFAGHAATSPGNLAILGVLAQFIHTTAVSIWVGGLWQLGLNLPLALRRIEREEKERIHAYLIPAFSTIALVSVGVLGASGLVLATLEVGSFSALATLYGNTLVVKTLIFLPLLGLGALNLVYLVPRVAGPRVLPLSGLAGPFSDFLTQTVRGEVFLTILALLAAATLAALPPATLASRLEQGVLPENDPQALAILRESDQAMNSLSTLIEHQFLRDDAGNLVHTIFEFQAPDRMRYHVIGGQESIAIGDMQYWREEDGSWRSAPRGPFVFPDFQYAQQAIGAHIDMQTESEGRPVTVVGFWLNPDLEYEFELWIDDVTHLILERTMEGPNHHMQSVYQFDPQLDIQPPTAGG